MQQNKARVLRKVAWPTNDLRFHWGELRLKNFKLRLGVKAGSMTEYERFKTPGRAQGRARRLEEALRSALAQLAEGRGRVRLAQDLGLADRSKLSDFLEGKRSGLPGLEPFVLEKLDQVIAGGLASLSANQTLLEALQRSSRVTIVSASRGGAMVLGAEQVERDYCSRWDVEAAVKLVNGLSSPRGGGPSPMLHMSHASESRSTVEDWRGIVRDNKQGSMIFLGSEIVNVATRAAFEHYLFPGKTESPFQFVWGTDESSSKAPRTLTRFGRWSEGRQRSIEFNGHRYEYSIESDYALICAHLFKLRSLIVVAGLGGPGTYMGCLALGALEGRVTSDRTWTGLIEVPLAVAGRTGRGDPRILHPRRKYRLVDHVLVELDEESRRQSRTPWTPDAVSRKSR